MKTALLGKIESHEAVVGVVGLGYVGLPLLMEFAGEKFPVRGFDIDAAKIEKIRTGKSYICHIPEARVQDSITHNPRAAVTTNFSAISDCDAVIICVPTPLTEHRDPDMSFIEGTARLIGPHVRKGQLISLESTTYPGTTEDVLIPILEEKCGLKAGRDFFVCFSPEREDPNNNQFSTKTIPKVVGGLDADSSEVANKLYGAVICQTVPVSSCRTAEATKLMENIFRCINIALVNELKIVFHKMDIDIWEVVQAAKTKPFGYMPFYPGPGLGGHCIPIDPFYLTWRARAFGVNTRFIELAGEINAFMPDYVVQQSMLALNEKGQTIKGCKILLVGLAYKQNVDDDRESPTYSLWDRLKALGAEVSYYDPYCQKVRPTREHGQYAGISSVAWDSISSRTVDLAIISTAHANVDHNALARRVPLVVDTRNACSPAPNVVKA